MEVCYRPLSFEKSLAEGTAVRIERAVPGALPDTEDNSDLLAGLSAAFITLPDPYLRAPFLGVIRSSISYISRYLLNSGLIILCKISRLLGLMRVF